MSPATVGDVDGRSPFASPPDCVTLARSIVNLVVAPDAGELSFRPYSLNVPVPPDVDVGSESLPVAKNM